VAANVKAGEAHGFNGTPQFRFLTSGRDPYPMSGAQPQARFDSIIAAMLTGAPLPAVEKPQEPAAPAELPLWARRDGLAPDPKRPGYTVSGDAYKGNPQAPVVVVEFSDFQCESCARHVLEVQPRIDATFVDTAQVMWVSKHLPLKKHPYAALAAVTAECAGDQGRYFEMRQRLYATTAAWAQPDAESKLLALAGELKLDPLAFERCFNGRPALERVMQDMADAQGIVQRTPSFVILSDGTTGSIAAPMPADQFIAFLRNQVDGATKPTAKK
jgi:protein-disulfide isomerase